MENTTLITDLKGTEIMHYVLLFCYNWKEKDFKAAFKDSQLGWDYFWDRLQGKIRNKVNPTEAITTIILNMDREHQAMLFNYVFSIRYSNDIQEDRDQEKLIEEHIKNTSQNTNI